jgi:small-conductance mechanosensitive channel
VNRLAGFLALATFAAARGDGQPSGQAVVDYLNQSITWYRRLASQSQLVTEPADVLFVDDDLQLGRQTIALAFESSRAQAALLSGSPAAPQAPGRSGLPGLAARASEAELAAQRAQAEVDALQRRIAASTRHRATLQRQLAETRSELALAQARAQTLKALSDFTSQAGNPSGSGLLAQIDELERSVPEARASRVGTNSSPRTSSATAVAARKTQPNGVISLFEEVLALSRKLREIRDTMELTGTVRAASDRLRTPLIEDLRSTLQQGDQLSAAPETTDAAMLADRRKKLDDLTAHFKKVSAALLPLDKQAVLLDAVRSNLAQWRAATDDQYESELRSLLLRVGLAVLVLMALAAASEFWRRATFRYVRDLRRRQQSLLVRRIVVTAAMSMVVVFSLVSELGSLATFAGFITAGLAVALQNVILSVAAYFLLVGKYGVHVGDRVQIGTVTGDVMDVGLVRLHVMEVRPDGLPTGRVVAFSNAVVFSNTNFFKQLPGSSFAWHELKLTLAPDTDYRIAESRLREAVNEVFEEYRAQIERQHVEMAQNIGIAVGQPRPEIRIHLTESGLEMLVRYPVPLQQAAAVDDRITRTLLEAIENEPGLKIVGSTSATLAPSDHATQ